MNRKVSGEDVYEYVAHHTGCSANEIARHFSVSVRTIYRHCNLLVHQGRLRKQGKTPRVQYFIQSGKNIVNTAIQDPSLCRLLEQEWYQISKIGQERKGVQGFVDRCAEKSIDPKQASIRRAGHIAYLDRIRYPWGINASSKLDDYETSLLSDLRYGNIYAFPEFGKTVYGTRMELAKTYPSVSIFSQLKESVVSILDMLVRQYAIDSVCFARPTAKRSLQIMDYLSKTLLCHLPRIVIQKTPGYFPAQKTLKHRADRIANAQASFALARGQSGCYHHTLIIDDAVGSGATLVEIGNKIIAGGLSKKVSGFGIVGTANGIFDQMKHFEVLASV